MSNAMTKMRTFDSMVRSASRKTLDTLLDVVTDAELAAYMAGRAKMNPGKIWDGYFKPMLEAMDKATRDEVLSNMANYQPSTEAGEMELGPSGSLASTGDVKEDEEEKPENKREPSRTGDAMRKWRGRDHERIAAMQRANEEHWKK